MRFDVQANEPEVTAHHVRLLGAASAISKDTNGGGAGITPTRTGTGAYTLTWAENPGVFQGWDYALGAATPANLAGHTAVRGTYASNALAFVVYNASDAAHDLAANEYIDIVVYFKG